MGPVEAWTTCIRKTFVFSHRAAPSEFWWFAPFWLLGTGVVIEFWQTVLTGLDPIYGPMLARCALAIPAISAAARRANDAGIKLEWIGGGLCAILFGFGLIDIANFVPNAGISAWSPPVSAVLIGLGFAGLAYLMTRPSIPGPNPHEVTP